MEKYLLEDITSNNSSIIKIIFDYQEQEECMLDKKTLKDLKSIYKNQAREENNIKNLLEKNIFDVNTKRSILDALINFKELFRDETSCLSERYYKVGFQSGIKLITESFKE